MDEASNEPVRFESGINRIAHLEKVQISQDGIKELHNNWEGLIIQMIIYHPLDKDQVMAVVGGHDVLENWNEPKIMELVQQTGSP